MFNNYDKRKVTKGEKNYITIQAQRYGTFTAQRDRDRTKPFFFFWEMIKKENALWFQFLKGILETNVEC